MWKKVKGLFAIGGVRSWFLSLIDAACVCVALISAVLLCKIRVISMQVMVTAAVAMPLLALIAFFNFLIIGVYRVIWRYASLKDYCRIVAGCILSCFEFAIIDKTWLKLINDFPTTIVTLVLMIAILTFSRIGYAMVYAGISDNGKKRSSDSKRTMIIGAGYTAKAVLEELLRGNDFYKPICVIDDDVDKIGRAIYGIPVVGNTNEIPKCAKKYNIDAIIFAIPSISENSRKSILNNCIVTDCELKVLPFVSEMIHNVNIVSQIKDVNIEDLLGRAPISFDEKDIESYIRDSVVMITGGGGSIGSELCRQISKYGPKKIMIAEIYENCAYDIQQEMRRDKGADYPFFVEIVSVTDYDKMNELFLEYRPDIIFHAAAHKHVPLMETNPEEAVKNNIYGTLNVAQLSAIHKVKKFIMISTDKAVNPTNVMGATKRCCEMIIQYMSQQNTQTEFAAVRFGNVLGSNGSVIPLFKEQIRKGGPVTVTHKDIIRYFMTIPEAVSLVLQAGAFAHGGEIFVLDMGSPVKIVTLAENLIRMMGYKPYEDIDIKFTGLRPGEKLYEELLMGEEGLKKTTNNKIFVGQQISIDTDKFMEQLNNMHVICMTNDKEAVVSQLRKLVPTFNSNMGLKEERKAVKLASGKENGKLIED